jgi:hypothetical protein
MTGITSPFRLFPPEIALRLGMTLVVTAVSILVTYAIPLISDASSRQKFLFSASLAVLTFYSIESNSTMRMVFSLIGLLYVILFPIAIGYIGFRELAIKGVYFDT